MKDLINKENIKQKNKKCPFFSKKETNGFISKIHIKSI